VQRVNVDGETALNAAEEALAAGNRDAAISGFQTIERAPHKPWMKDWAQRRLEQLGVKSASADASVAPATPASAAPAQSGAAVALRSAQQLLAAKEFQKAIATIDASRGEFTEPVQQAEAEWCIAEARNGLAQAAGGNDANALKDAALAYMRIVANFSDLPGKPHVADALMKTAAIEEQLGEKPQALSLYQQVASQFPEDATVVAAAKQSAQRLSNP
jgi:TolA-binding protein